MGEDFVLMMSSTPVKLFLFLLSFDVDVVVVVDILLGGDCRRAPAAAGGGVVFPRVSILLLSLFFEVGDQVEFRLLLLLELFSV